MVTTHDKHDNLKALSGWCSVQEPDCFAFEGSGSGWRKIMGGGGQIKFTSTFGKCLWNFFLANFFLVLGFLCLACPVQEEDRWVRMGRRCGRYETIRNVSFTSWDFTCYPTPIFTIIFFTAPHFGRESALGAQNSLESILRTWVYSFKHSGNSRGHHRGPEKVSPRSAIRTWNERFRMCGGFVM